MSMSVCLFVLCFLCLSVHEQISGTILPIFSKCFMHFTCGRGSMLVILLAAAQWCIAKNGGGYTQRGAAKGLEVPCLFMITEVSIRCQKKPGGWYTPYSRRVDC